VSWLLAAILQEYSLLIRGGAGGNCIFSNIFQSGSSVFITAACKNGSGGTVTTTNFDLSEPVDLNADEIMLTALGQTVALLTT
jgi:hypothetical protein